MNNNVEQLIEQLKTAKTPAEMARLTAALLRACGIYNFQGVALEMARICVTSRAMGG